MRYRTINATELREIFIFLAERLTREEANLNALDAAVGDGDHGITMRVGFSAITSRLAGLPADVGVPSILKEAGTTFTRATGGAIGILFGKMLVAAGAAVEGHQELGPTELRMLFDAMERALSSTGKAKPGDKTVLDAVHAANIAVSALGGSSEDLLAIVSHGSEAATNAARSTAYMLARLGRASRLGSRVLGHPDAGAVSFSIILSGIAEWLRAHPAGGASEDATSHTNA